MPFLLRSPRVPLGLSLLAAAAAVWAAPSEAVLAWPAHAVAPPRDPGIEQRVEQLLQGLSLRQKIGQMTQPEIGAITPEQVREFAIGTVLNGGGSWPADNRAATPAQWRALSEAYQRAALEATPGVPLIWGTDAVHGHGNARGATLFPHHIGLGATGDADLVREIGRATARSVRATGLQWVFAPTLAVVQDVRWGRTYESFSADPALVRRLGRAEVEGLQEGFGQGRGVIATAKHYVGDGGTHHGRDQGITRATPQDLARLHGAGYYGALDAGVLSVMASFNSWTDASSATPRGKLHGNPELLTEVLKQRLGFDGLIVSDWDGIGQVPGCRNDDCPAAINAGIDIVMVPTQWRSFIANTLRAVELGRIPMSRIDDAVRRILRVKLRAGLPTTVVASTGPAQLPDESALARRAVRESLVLLKHRPGLLPLKPGARVLVVGAAADSLTQQTGGWSTTWQGSETSNADYPQGQTLLQALRERLGAAQVSFDPEGRTQDPARFDAVVAVLAERPYAEGEGDIALTDTLRHSRRYPEQLELLRRVQGRGAPVVSLLFSGRPVYASDLINRSDAFIAAWLPGTAGAGLADVLVAPEAGRAWPGFSGRLAFPWPAGPCQFRVNDGKPAWPIGAGLSGTEKAPAPPPPLPEPPEPAGLCPM
jgi:beta-glucosidase